MLCVLKDLLCCEPVSDTAQYARCGIGLIQCEDGSTNIGCTLLVLYDKKGEVDYVLTGKAQGKEERDSLLSEVVCRDRRE